MTSKKKIAKTTYSKDSDYDKLKKLSLTAGSRFKINGDEKLFRIIIGDNKKFILALITILLILILYILNNIESKIFFWSFVLIVLFWIVIFLFYLDLKKEVTINSKKRIVVFKEEPLVNITGKLPIVINFYDVKGFSLKKITLDKHNFITSYEEGSLNSHYNTVFINLKDKNLRLIDLNAGPCVFVDQEIFIKSLTKIIK